MYCRDGLNDKEMEEYQKQLRQRPHMISINNSNNIKRKEEKKKKVSKYPTRTPRRKYQYKVCMLYVLDVEGYKL